MGVSNLANEIKKRRTFAIISHPDAGKTTITEKILLFGGAINVAGAVKSNKTSTSKNLPKVSYSRKKLKEKKNITKKNIELASSD